MKLESAYKFVDKIISPIFNSFDKKFDSSSFEYEIGIVDVLFLSGIVSSKSEGRRLVQQNGIAVNGEKFTDPKGMVDLSEQVIIKKGKKVFHKVVLG